MQHIIILTELGVATIRFCPSEHERTAHYDSQSETSGQGKAAKISCYCKFIKSRS